MKLKALGAADIREAISMGEAIEVVKGAFAQLSSKKAQAPVRTSLELKQEGEAALIMAAYLGETKALGAKIVTVLPHNPQRGLPAVQAMVILFNAETGEPAAILEGTYLTRFRTGAATGAATQMLSRLDCRRLALFGAGGQALGQVEGVLAARKIEGISVFDLRPERMPGLIGDLKMSPWGKNLEILAARSPAEALKGADIVVTATNSFKPVFDGEGLKEGTHINAIGAFRPGMQEVDEKTIRRARVFVDSVEACLAEAGDLIIPLQKGLIERSDILAELGEVISGKKPGRKNDREITYFKSVGNAVQDVSLAQAIWQRAIQKGLGQEVEL